MGECLLRRRGLVSPDSLLPSFSYTEGGYSLVDEGKVDNIRNWNLTLNEGGVFVPRRNMCVDIFVLGGGGAGNKDGKGGGGGYYITASGIILTKGTEYIITIGAGGDENGEDGESSVGFGYTANGGSGGVSGTEKYHRCIVRGAPDDGDNVYYYDSPGVPGESCGYDPMSVSLVHPLEMVENFIVSGQLVYPVYKAYPSGYYKCRILSTESTYYTDGATGKGSDITQIFGAGTEVGGSGQDSGASNAVRNGQGGAGNGTYGGSAFGAGGNGLIVLRNAR